ncbi:hypothetical protein [Streptomyces sp. A1-5]|uniref:hypothetical protein n=1 Tax=Streptomyces sp. A1-5 TaxID=2738410 RepID=UPI001F32A7B7|nr:hypothetical protein [Streptomyces sp. A1-5]UJB46017.1 hypothetical protein HRD51_39420 [Streptomyces sp. A1-5]
MLSRSPLRRIVRKVQFASPAWGREPFDLDRRLPTPTGGPAARADDREADHLCLVRPLKEQGYVTVDECRNEARQQRWTIEP